MKRKISSEGKSVAPPPGKGELSVGVCVCVCVCRGGWKSERSGDRAG